ncbi:MIP transporter [Penicillium canescens]|nr:MIP transporter [Penicillium canescens]
MVVAYLPHLEHEDHPYLEPATHPFAGRVGGNQDFIVDRNDPKNVEVLKELPDATPRMTLAEIFDLRGRRLPHRDLLFAPLRRNNQAAPHPAAYLYLLSIQWRPYQPDDHASLPPHGPVSGWPNTGWSVGWLCPA